ncbi:MAG: Maf family protein [Pseudomonadota bacterium]
MKVPPPRLVLASTSPYRRELLARLGLPFDTCAPDVDESAVQGERPDALALRLSQAKAAAVGRRHPDALIIGSDQVAALDDRVLTKPGNRANAIRQLEFASGRTVDFYTGVAVLNARTARCRAEIALTRVRFRPLTRNAIESYLDREPAFDCAGSARVEALGIALLEQVDSDDPTALIGLPLIRVVSMLAQEGLSVL